MSWCEKTRKNRKDILYLTRVATDQVSRPSREDRLQPTSMWKALEVAVERRNLRDYDTEACDSIGRS